MYRAFGKRLLDLLLSCFGLMVCAPVFLIVPLIIKLNSPGSVFFRQIRMGRSGRPFYLLKFRSMITDADCEKKGFEPGASSRVTAAGKFLRRTKLDEIPQLVNVLMGEMSFVGPRPEVERYRDSYAGKFKDVFRVRPGITDMASIKYRNEEEILRASADPQKTYREVILPDKLEMALLYVQGKIQFHKDLTIIIKTLLSIMKRPK